jgi:hypothetical protein
MGPGAGTPVRAKAVSPASSLLAGDVASASLGAYSPAQPVSTKSRERPLNKDRLRALVFMCIPSGSSLNVDDGGHCKAFARR